MLRVLQGIYVQTFIIGVWKVTAICPGRIIVYPPFRECAGGLFTPFADALLVPPCDLTGYL
jgi:hypothetical protein